MILLLLIIRFHGAVVPGCGLVVEEPPRGVCTSPVGEIEGEMAVSVRHGPRKCRVISESLRYRLPG